MVATFTKTAIKKSFMKLLNEKPLNKITVKDIVEDCKINRNSFYYHYSDIPSLLEETFNEQADKLVQDSHPTSIYECITDAIDFALDNKRAVLHIFNSSNSDVLYQYLSRVSAHTINEFIDHFALEYSKKISNEDKAVIIMYYKSLLAGFVLDWANSGMNYDLKENTRRLCELFEGTTETAFSRALSSIEQE